MRINTNAHAGQFSLLLAVTNTAATPNNSQIEQNVVNQGGVPVIAGQTYALSFRAWQAGSGVSLVQNYRQNGPVFEARVCLTPDDTNKFSGFKWSSSQGPPKKVESGSLASASLVVDQRKPYTYVVPAVRRATGI